MLKQVVFLTLIIVLSFPLFAIGDGDTVVIDTSFKKASILKSPYSPTIGLGIGMLKFYGDVLDAKRGNPLISRIAYDLHVKQQLNSFLTAKFYVLFGKIGANERTLERNLNFQSQITTGGFSLAYNFDQFLPKERVIDPYISLGIESMEFHSKTDMFDAYGNKYNYWSDGSIRTLSENDINAQDALIIQRDYIYETDLRESDFDGLGKYPDRAFSIPFGVGARMHISENIKFSLGTTLHFTFSDLVDNVTSESLPIQVGTVSGNKANDKFLMTSFSIGYNFKNDKDDTEEIYQFDYDNNLYVSDGKDEDKDGVTDFWDECPFTPKGVAVDQKGCPLDSDNDFVPNYRDNELASRKFVPVTPAGVEMTDSVILEIYLCYLDSTGEIVRRFIAEKLKLKNKEIESYKVQIGSYKETVPDELMEKFLGISDLEVKKVGDSLTIFTAGSYDNIPDAVIRKHMLAKQGVETSGIVGESRDGSITLVGDKESNMGITDEPDNVQSDEVFFRVQLGAFSKKQPLSKFRGLNVIEIKGDDGLYKYLIDQSYRTMKGAALRKVDLVVDYGIKDAYVVAYKKGRRVSLRDAGVSSAPIEEILVNKYDKEAVRFSVQVGIYKDQLPIEMLSLFMSLGDIQQIEGENGLTRYTSGSFKTYQEAENHKKTLDGKGIEGVFIIALHKKDLIPIDKAKELLGE